MVDIVLVEAFGTAFFLLLFGVSAYMYQKTKEKRIPLYLTAAMFLLFMRETAFFLADAGLINVAWKVGGGVLAFAAGVLFLYVFVAEERTLKDLHRIRNAFK